MIKNILKNWTHVEEPTKKELEKIVEDFDLEISLLEDALDPFEVSRAEKEDGIIYFFIRAPLPVDEISLTTPVLFVIKKNSLITISKRNLPLLDKLIDIGFEEENGKAIDVFIRIFKEINSVYNNSLIVINRNIWRISNDIEKINNKDIAQFVDYERVTNDYLSRLIQNGVVLNQLNNQRYIKLDEEEGELAEDLLLANNQLIDIGRNSLLSVKNIRDAYSTILSNDLNRVIKLLTSLTIILNVPTIISGLWGMNVPVPFAKTIYGFELVLLIALIISVVLIKVFRKKDWL